MIMTVLNTFTQSPRQFIYTLFIWTSYHLQLCVTVQDGLPLLLFSLIAPSYTTPHANSAQQTAIVQLAD